MFLPDLSSTLIGLSESSLWTDEPKKEANPRPLGQNLGQLVKRRAPFPDQVGPGRAVMQRHEIADDG